MEIPYTIIGDNIGEKSEEFTITLDNPTNGDISGEDTIATIRIIDDEAPVLSIGNGDAVTESDQAMAMFPVTASFNANEVTVYFTPSDSTADFLGSDFTENEMISASLDFSGGINSTLLVAIDNDNIEEEDGFITVTLVEDQSMVNNQPVITYSVATGPADTGTVVVIDDDSLPVVSIIPDSGEVAENAGPAKFMLAATGLTAITTLMINATPAEDGSDFLADAIEETKKDFPVKFSDSDGDNTYTGELEVSLVNDSVGEATGEIKLTLNADPDSAETYRLGATTEGVITILDDDAPELKIASARESVNEADNASAEFVITAAVSPNDKIEVRYNLVENGDVIDKENPIFNPGEGKSVELDFSNRVTEATLSIPIANDIDDERNTTITVTLVDESAGPVNYTVAPSPNNSAAVEVIDDDGPPQINISTSTPSIEEGETAVFTLSATPEGSITPDQPKKVEFKVEQEGDFLLWRVARTFIMESTSETFIIKTRDNNIEMDDGSVTLSLVNSPNNYVISENSELYSAKVIITDNDDDPNKPQATEPDERISVAQIAVNNILNEILGQSNNPASAESVIPSPTLGVLPKVSIDAFQTQVNEGSPVEFVISASGGPDSNAILVNLHVNPVGDFFDINEPKQISRLLQDQESVQVIFPTIDDTIAEADGQLEVSIIPDASYNIDTSKSTSTVIISDEIDRQLRQDLLLASSQAFLPDVVGNMAARTTDLIEQRIQQGFAETSNVTLNLGGENTLAGLIEMSGEMTNEGSVTWQEILGDSSFTMTLLSSDDFAAPTTIWGIGDYRDLSANSSDNSQAWSGDVFTGQFGIDALIEQEILTGLSASISENDISVGNENTEELNFTLNSSTINPYLGWTSSNLNAELRAIASLGVGEFTIEQASYDFEVLASKSYSVALAGHKELYSSESILNGTTKLQLVGDSWFARQNITGKSNLISDLQTDAQYLRINTEGTHQFEFERGSSLTPLISTGIRRDQKDQRSLFGLEFTGGIDYTDPIGLTLSGYGSMLLAKENEIQKMSLKGSFEYDYGSDDLGLTFSLSPTWGQTQTEVQNSLWSNNILTSDKTVGQYTEGTQLSSELGYGFMLGEESSRLNLYSGFEFDVQADDKLLLGTRVSIGPNFGLDFERTGTISSLDSEATRYQLNGRLSW